MLWHYIAIGFYYFLFCSCAGWQICVPPDTTSLHHNVDATNRITGVISNGSVPLVISSDAAGNLVYDGQYVYQYDGLNRLVQVNRSGTVVFDGSGRPIAGQLGTFYLRYIYDGVGRIIRKDQPDEVPPGGTYAPVRSNDYYYDGIRRIQDVIRRPIQSEPPDPCDEFLAVTRSPGTYGEWIRSDGQSIGVELEPCQPTMGEGGNSGGSGGPTGGDPGGGSSGSTFETWTDREYVYDPSGDLGSVDQFIVQVSRDGTPLYMHQSASLDVVALTHVDSNGQTVVSRQDAYSPYGEIAAMDYFTQLIADTGQTHGTKSSARIENGAYEPMSHLHSGICSRTIALPLVTASHLETRVYACPFLLLRHKKSRIATKMLPHACGSDWNATRLKRHARHLRSQVGTSILFGGDGGPTRGIDSSKRFQRNLVDQVSHS